MEWIHYACSTVLILTAPLSVAAQEQSAEFKLFQGNWNVAELVENGQVIPAEKIKDVLPSGGRVEIVDNAVVFRSSDDHQLRARTFSIDATRYPKTIDISSRDSNDGWGIYRFDSGKLVICVSATSEGERPDEFSAPAGSDRMLLVLSRPASPAASPKPRTVPDAKPAASDDAALRDSLVGTWRYMDSIGALIVKLGANGAYSTTREVKELRVFQTVFVSTPVSNGTWKVENGSVIFHVTGANDPERLHRVVPFSIRSVSATDFIFVDSIGRVGKATRLR